MKRKSLLIFVPLFLLSACQGTQDAKFSFKSFPVYTAASSETNDDGVIDLSKQKKQEFSLAFLPDQPLLPYVKVSDYVRLFEEVEAFISGEQDNGKTYTVTFARNKINFGFSFDSEAKSITIAGDFRYIMNGQEEKDRSSNAIEGRVTNSQIGDPNAAYALSYKETEIATFSYQGALYAPLTLLDNIFIKIAGAGYYFAYDRVYIYAEPTSLPKFKFIDKQGDTPYTLAKTMSAAAQGAKMPMYLRRINRDMVTFLFDNFYGLKYAKDIKSVAAYLKSTTYYEDMLSEDAETRANALNLFVQQWNDGHTALASEAGAWEESAKRTIPQSIIDTRTSIEESLVASRKAVYDSIGLKTNQVRYSKDGSTAVFTLGKFASYENFYDETSGEPTTTIEEAAKQDTYLQSKAHFEEIDKKGGVTNVIIDMSINEGGDSGTMGNLLTLLSKDNQSKMHLQDIFTGATHVVTTRLDTNRDGKVDEKDKTYGNYKIYLLVSPAAFSCGTAYPFFASAQGLAKIIGQKPGGGECVLGQAIMPNGQAIYHSSTLRVCVPKNGGFIYDEAGPEIDVGFDYRDFYDLEKMVAKLEEEEEE